MKFKDELPPFLRSWNQSYVLLVLWLVLLILLFNLFTRTFE
ncbi:MAG TPA: hypothetical protein VGD92_11260 [Sphingobacteriaceae bacterium]